MNLLARLRYWLARVEACQRCGREQPLIWWCEDKALWQEVTGCGEGGVFCPTCFDKLADEKGILLYWEATVWKRKAVEK